MSLFSDVLDLFTLYRASQNACCLLGKTSSQKQEMRSVCAHSFSCCSYSTPLQPLLIKNYLIVYLVSDVLSIFYTVFIIYIELSILPSLLYEKI